VQPIVFEDLRDAILAGMRELNFEAVLKPWNEMVQSLTINSGDTKDDQHLATDLILSQPT